MAPKKPKRGSSSNRRTYYDVLDVDARRDPHAPLDGESSDQTSAYSPSDGAGSAARIDDLLTPFYIGLLLPRNS